MGFRFAKSIRLGGGGRLNLSRKGIGASWGFKGFRVGVSPRTGGYARTGLGLLNFGRGKRISGAGCSNSGCGVLVIGAVVLFVAVAILRAIVAVFSTPYPWIALGLVVSFFLLRPVIRRFRRDRLEKAFFDALAAVDERARDPEERLRILLRQAPEQADGYLLAAARAALWRASWISDSKAPRCLFGSTTGPLRFGQSRSRGLPSRSRPVVGTTPLRASATASRARRMTS